MCSHIKWRKRIFLQFFLITCWIHALCVDEVSQTFSCVLVQVKEELLVEALTKRKTVTVNDKLILPYSHSEVCFYTPLALPVLSELPDVLYLNECGFFRRSPRGTPWPSRCTALCSTGSSCGSITRCSIRKTWRSPFRWAINIFSLKVVQGLILKLFLPYFSVCLLVCLTSSASKTLRPTALNNSASTTPTSSFSITSTSTFLNLNRLVGSAGLHGHNLHTPFSYGDLNEKCVWSICRRSISPRASPGTTSTTPITSDVFTSSARSPLDSSIYLMRRASKTIHLSLVHCSSLPECFCVYILINTFSL